MLNKHDTYRVNNHDVIPTLFCIGDILYTGNVLHTYSVQQFAGFFFAYCSI